MKTLRSLGLLLLFLTALAKADGLGQTVQINTNFKIVYGKPSWLLIIRDVESGRVLPYLFDITNNANFWVAFTSGRAYKITASTLTFGPYATINNFCGLEDGILTGQSLQVSLSGELSPIRSSSNCRVIKYNSVPLPIARPTN